MKNVGGQIASNTAVQIRTTAGISAQTVQSINPSQSVRVRWQLPAQEAGPLSLTCSAQANGTSEVSKTFRVTVNSAPDAAKTAGLRYPPEPQPVDTGDSLVGCYYYPGWPIYGRWSVLNDFPERRPVLGYYREGSPEVADWQSTWALTHGIDFFIFDWYWSSGTRQLEHALHDGFMKSRYFSKMKFCLLWANHNPPTPDAEKDLLSVTKYWIENYFSRPNYLKVDGKNVMVIFSPDRITADLGAKGTKAAFGKMKRMCESAGVGGLHLVACTVPGTEHNAVLVEEGYDALSGYNYPGAGSKGHSWSPYAWMVDSYRDIWQQVAEPMPVPYIPVCEAGWDARPWHGTDSGVRTGKSPELFEKMLRNAKSFVDNPQHKTPQGKKLVFLEAWNEFGEGDFIEPSSEFGFGYLEAVRRVFAPESRRPDIVVPEDIGAGPYDEAVPRQKTEWIFSSPESFDWRAQGVADVSFISGFLSCTTDNWDPQFYSPLTEIDAYGLTKLEVKMKLDKGETAQFFFAPAFNGISEERSVKFSVIPDNQWHVYEVDLSKNRRWRGRFEMMRLDPPDVQGAKLEIAYIRLRN